MQRTGQTPVMTTWLMLWGLLFTAGMHGEAAAADIASDTEALRVFEESIRPVLATRCVSCHGVDAQEGGLRLDSHAGLTAGGDSGPVVVAGNAAESLLIAAVRRDGLEMLSLIHI